MKPARAGMQKVFQLRGKIESFVQYKLAQEKRKVEVRTYAAQLVMKEDQQEQGAMQIAIKEYQQKQGAMQKAGAGTHAHCILQ